MVQIVIDPTYRIIDAGWCCRYCSSRSQSDGEQWIVRRLLLTIESKGDSSVEVERQIRLSPEHLGCLLLCCRQRGHTVTVCTAHTGRQHGQKGGNTASRIPGGQQDGHPDERGSGDGAMISLAANDRIIFRSLTFDLIPNTNDASRSGRLWHSTSFLSDLISTSIFHTIVHFFTNYLVLPQLFVLSLFSSTAMLPLHPSKRMRLPAQPDTELFTY